MPIFTGIRKNILRKGPAPGYAPEAGSGAGYSNPAPRTGRAPGEGGVRKEMDRAGKVERYSPRRLFTGFMRAAFTVW